MSDSAASSPEPSSQAEIVYPAAVAPPPPPPPPFRSAAANAAMQASYQGSVVSGMNYSDRPYENQMLCQSNSYSSYQPPPSPYRPHPVSPPTHSVHQYGSQMHSNVPYPSGHQMSPYASSQGHYGSTTMGQDMYSGRPPSSMYSGTSTGGGGNTSNNHMLQQMKATSSWGTEGDMMQAYGHQSPRQPMLSSPSPMPPPPLRSPPHMGGGTGSAASTVASANHYRSQMVSSSPSHSPHSWPQQIPSPGSVLHSPRATPSPLPSRSPAHSQFSPPPSSTTPSPHHPPPSATPHQSLPLAPPPPPKSSPASPIESLNSPGSVVVASSQQQSSSGSTDPLQSLQKMVMLDSSGANSDGNVQVVRGGATYDLSATSGHPHHPQQQQHHHHHQQQQHHSMPTGRPASYFSSVENLAGHDPGSPYPTYYNLDQNRLCTPPRTVGSTPTSSTFTSAPDSTSNSSVSGDSYPTLDQQQQQQHQVPQLANGDMSHQNCALSRQDCDQRTPLVDCSGLANGGNGQESSSSHDMMAAYDVPQCFITEKKPLKGVRGRRKSMPSEFSAIVDTDRDMNDRMFLSPPLKNNYPLSQDPDSGSLTNGQLDYQDERMHPVVRKRGRGAARFSSPPAHWNRAMGDEEMANMSQEVACGGLDNGVYLSMVTKRTPRKRRSTSCPTGDMPPDGYLDPSGVGVTRSPRSRGRSPRPGRGRGRRRAGVVNPFVGDRNLDQAGAYLDLSRNSLDGLHHEAGLAAPPLLGRDGWGEDPSMPMGGEDGMMREDHTSLLPAPMMEVPRGSSNMVNLGLHSDPQQQPQYAAHLTNLNDCSQGLSSSQLSQDGSSSLGHPPMSEGGIPSTPHNLLNSNQLASGSSGEKKRGRPRGSKNKPKLPGEERKPPGKGKGKRKVEDDPSSTQLGMPRSDYPTSNSRPLLTVRGRPFTGPYVHIEGTRQNPTSMEVVNLPSKDEEKDLKCSKGGQKNRLHPAPASSHHSLGAGGIGHLRRKLVHTSTLSPLYDAFTRDKSWVCSLCHKGSHYRGLGDLFGPYYSSSNSNVDDQKPSEIATPSSGVPTPLSITAELGAENDQDLAMGNGGVIAASAFVSGSVGASSGRDSTTPCSIKPLRTKRRRSDLAEEYFKSTVVKRARQASHPSFIQGKKYQNQPESQPCGATSGVVDIPALSPATPSSSIEESSNGTEYWVHEDCAVWSHGVYLLRQSVRGLDDAIREAADMVCCKCKLSGATIGCLTRGCGEQYHFICAADRGCEMDEENISILCPKHKRKARGERTEEGDGC